MHATIYDIALTFVEHLGPRGVAHLIERFGTAEAIFAASEEELLVRGELRSDIVRQILGRSSFSQAERELKHCQKYNIEPVAVTDDSYPQRLRFIPDPPHVIYVMGNIEALHQMHALSVVGTRRMTTYGERMCNSIIEGVAQQCPDTAIISGLAYGSDAAAHRAALVCNLPTVAVLANALPAIIPAANRGLASDIIARGGAILTEVSSQTPSNGNLYIPRNRIVAALADGLLVVESGISGGSLHTAKAADGYSRTVMALPGRATDAMSAGCNHLIYTGAAQLVTSAEHLLTLLGWESSSPTSHIRAEVAPLEDNERRLLACFGSAAEAVGIDTLIIKSGFSAAEVSAILFNLEMSGVVRELPGKMFEKLIND